MNPRQLEIREEQKASWNRFSAGWKKWDSLTMKFLKPAGDAIINVIRPSGSQSILDIASGTGEPGLTIASMIPDGKVMLTDLAGDMLAICREHAAAREIRNADTFVCDVSELPFPEGSFDAISCRFGFMFFPDMELAAQEMYRVLKKGGKLATTVWNIPEKNFWVRAVMGTIQKHLEPPPVPSGDPGMFRCCKPGLMESILQKAGFTDIQVEEITVNNPAQSVDEYWEMMTDVGAPVVAALSQASPDQKEAIKADVYKTVQEHSSGNIPSLEGSSLIIRAVKG